MKVPGLDAYYGDPPEDEVCDACAFTDTHCGECEDCCGSFEDHPEIHPEPEPDCHKCTLVALTKASLKLVELKVENEQLQAECQKLSDQRLTMATWIVQVTLQRDALARQVQAVRQTIESESWLADARPWPLTSLARSPQVAVVPVEGIRAALAKFSPLAHLDSHPADCRIARIAEDSIERHLERRAEAEQGRWWHVEQALDGDA